ncbi:hypothetical protein [Aliivibrio fischeri]|uniref:hypothetical protein n=1 Tax=Aliivibrio fischeri TaxID=668 RepID=UPI00166B915C|nr:hypothetical protein [Aliivibrio fischeri]USR97953.1 hypothetical protein AVFI_15925 [Aliivibrio fischeri ATCC 7744 = JCM 18803 = DSM 507]GGK20264.1 hypothetical protein GCM10007987_00230 [Aliivibrio fischeri]
MKVLILLLLMFSTSSFAKQENKKIDYSGIQVLLTQYGKDRGRDVKLDRCLIEKEIDEQVMLFDEDFLQQLFYNEGITSVVTQSEIKFSCKEKLIQKRFKNLPNLDFLEGKVTPILHSRSLLSRDIDVTMPKDAWDMFNKNSSKDKKELIESNTVSKSSELHHFQFVNRTPSDAYVDTLINFILDSGGESAFYDKKERTLFYSLGSLNKNINSKLLAMDKEEKLYKLMLTKLVVNADSIAKFIYNTNTNLESKMLKDICAEQCEKEQVISYLENLSPHKDINKIFALRKQGLDVSIAETKAELIESHILNIAQGNENNINRTIDSSNVGDDEAVYQSDIYTIESGFSLDMEINYFNKNRSKVSYSLQDGEQNIEQLNDGVIAVNRIKNTGDAIVKHQEEKKLFSIISNKETEQEKIFPILGYIPWVGGLFNSYEMINNEQYIYYYVNISPI